MTRADQSELQRCRCHHRSVQNRTIPDQLASLAAQYQATGDATIQLTVTGEPAAAGQPVTLTLAFAPSQITVTVKNPLPLAGEQGPLAATGAGAGLTGLKERAALAGGTLETGPADGTWRTNLTMPA